MGSNMAVKLELVSDNSRKDVALYELYKLYARKSWTSITFEKWKEKQEAIKHDRP